MKKPRPAEFSPITFEQSAHKNAPGLNKDDRKHFNSPDNSSQKPISYFFQFTNPMLHNSIPGAPIYLNISVYSGLRIMAINAQCSLFKKMEEFFVDVIANNIDILCVMETGLEKDNTKPTKIGSMGTKHWY